MVPTPHAHHATQNGSALEHFGGIGRWREKESGLPIDARGELPSGELLDGVVSCEGRATPKMGNLGQSLPKKLNLDAPQRVLSPEDE